MINIEDFKKIEIKIGKIVSAEKVEGSDKLLKLSVDFGPSSAKASEGEGRNIRQVISGIARAYPDPSVLVGKEASFVSNLEPREIMGLQSQAMIMAATGTDDLPVILTPEKDVPPGSAVR